MGSRSKVDSPGQRHLEFGGEARPPEPAAPVAVKGELVIGELADSGSSLPARATAAPAPNSGEPLIMNVFLSEMTSSEMERAFDHIHSWLGGGPDRIYRDHALTIGLEFLEALRDSLLVVSNRLHTVMEISPQIMGSTVTRERSVPLPPVPELSVQQKEATVKLSNIAMDFIVNMMSHYNLGQGRRRAPENLEIFKSIAEVGFQCAAMMWIDLNVPQIDIVTFHKLADEAIGSGLVSRSQTNLTLLAEMRLDLLSREKITPRTRFQTGVSQQMQALKSRAS